MKKLLLASLLMFSLTANATLINTDWLEEGDSKLVSDDATGLDWLVLTETYGLSGSEMLLLLEDGEIYDDFRYATAEETNIMMMSVLSSAWGVTEEGINDAGYIQNFSKYSSTEYYQDIVDFTALFGIVYSRYASSSDNHYHSKGLVYDETEGTLSLFGVTRRIYFVKNGSYRTVFSDYGDYDLDYTSYYVGHFLVKDTQSLSNATEATEVSEPSTLAIFFLSILGLGFSRKRKSNIS